MRIGLVVDHPRRDLTGMVKLAYELARRGTEAVLLPHYEQGMEAPLLGLDGVLLNNARPHYAALVEGYRSLGTAVFVLDTEGGVLPNEGPNAPEAIAERVRALGFDRRLAGYFLWGERMHEAFRARSGLDAGRLQVTGCPRFDLTAEPWRALLGGYPARGYVLVNTNFPIVNPLIAPGSERERGALRQLGFADAEIERRKTAVGGVYRRFLDEIARLVGARRHTRFVLRPHPFESGASYETRFAGEPNIAVDGAGEVLPVIEHARAVLQVNCTTAIEANMLGRLPVSLDHCNDPAVRRLNPLPSRISRSVGSAAELDRVLDEVEAEAAGFPFASNYDAHIRPWFGAPDGAAAARVAEGILARMPAARGRVGFALSALAAGHRPARPAQRALGLAGTLLGTRTVAALRERRDPGRRAKRFSAAEVGGKLAALAAADPAPAAATAVGLRHPRTGLALLSVGVIPG